MLAIGIVVDDAIVVLENIERHDSERPRPPHRHHQGHGGGHRADLAVGLVLCAVFVPCSFISGITGQFFRQFAVTIAVSTVISAVNAITMTPSRAVLIFKTEERDTTGHELKREALPWWIFGVVGGCWPSGTGQTTLAADLALPPPCSRGRRSRASPAGCPGRSRPAISLPGRWSGGTVRLVVHPAGECRAGLALPRLQPALRRHDSRLWLDGRQAAAVSAVLVLLVYGGLVVADVLDISACPDGFIPQQDQGRLS